MLLTVGVVILVLALLVGVLAIWWYRRPVYWATAHIEIVTPQAAQREERPPENI